MVAKINFKNAVIIFVGLFFFILFSGTTCKPKHCHKGSHKYINIQNNSGKTVNWRAFTPDSVYTINGSMPAADNIIFSNSSFNYGDRDCWEETFKDGYSGYFLIFANDTVQAIGWQAINGTNRGLLKRIKVDLNYLNNNNFTITYP